jgi:hypothetical protein
MKVEGKDMPTLGVMAYGAHGEIVAEGLGKMAAAGAGKTAVPGVCGRRGESLPMLPPSLMEEWWQAHWSRARAQARARAAGRAFSSERESPAPACLCF